MGIILGHRQPSCQKYHRSQKSCRNGSQSRDQKLRFRQHHVIIPPQPKNVLRESSAKRSARKKTASATIGGTHGVELEGFVAGSRRDRAVVVAGIRDRVVRQSAAKT